MGLREIGLRCGKVNHTMTCVLCFSKDFIEAFLLVMLGLQLYSYKAFEITFDTLNIKTYSELSKYRK